MIICFLWNTNLFFVIPWETLVDCLHFSGLFAGWQSRQVNVSLQCNFKNLQQTQPIEASRTHGGQKRRESESLVLTNLKRSREGHRTTQNLTSIDRDKNIMSVSFWLRITAMLRTEHLACLTEMNNARYNSQICLRKWQKQKEPPPGLEVEHPL